MYTFIKGWILLSLLTVLPLGMAPGISSFAAAHGGGEILIFLFGIFQLLVYAVVLITGVVRNNGKLVLVPLTFPFAWAGFALAYRVLFYFGALASGMFSHSFPDPEAIRRERTLIINLNNYYTGEKVLKLIAAGQVDAIYSPGVKTGSTNTFESKLYRIGNGPNCASRNALFAEELLKANRFGECVTFDIAPEPKDGLEIDFDPVHQPCCERFTFSRVRDGKRELLYTAQSGHFVVPGYLPFAVSGRISKDYWTAGFSMPFVAIEYGWQDIRDGNGNPTILQVLKTIYTDPAEHKGSGSPFPAIKAKQLSPQGLADAALAMGDPFQKGFVASWQAVEVALRAAEGGAVNPAILRIIGFSLDYRSRDDRRAAIIQTLGKDEQAKIQEAAFEVMSTRNVYPRCTQELKCEYRQSIKQEVDRYYSSIFGSASLSAISAEKRNAMRERALGAFNTDGLAGWQYGLAARLTYDLSDPNEQRNEWRRLVRQSTDTTRSISDGLERTQGLRLLNQRELKDDADVEFAPFLKQLEHVPEEMFLDYVDDVWGSALHEPYMNPNSKHPQDKIPTQYAAVCARLKKYYRQYKFNHYKEKMSCNSI